MHQELDLTNLAKYFSGECSAEEKLEIERWMSLNDENANTVRQMKHLWELSGQKTVDWDIDSAWRKVSKTAGIKPTLPGTSVINLTGSRSIKPDFQLVPRFFVRVAAAIALLIGIPYIVIHITQMERNVPRTASVREITTDKGHLAKFRFDEGTKVILNAASNLRFPERFDDKFREVNLEGEAFFEVAPLNGVPFLVKTHGATIEVLGTEFCVQAWPGEKQVQVVVAEGRVALRSGEGEARKSIVLTRGQMSAMSETGELSGPISIDIDKHLAWVSGKLLFDNTPFREVLKSLERKYNLSCYTADSVVLSRRLTATFKDEPVNEVLRIISLSLDLTYKRLRDTVIFIKRK